jgi:hypothetical protein
MNNLLKEMKLHNIAAKYIVGEIDSLNESDTYRAKKYIELVNKCKELKESLELNDNMDKIAKILDEKRTLAIEFENITGIKWRL